MTKGAKNEEDAIIMFACQQTRKWLLLLSLLCLTTLSRCLDIHRRGVYAQHMEYNNGLQTPRQQGQFHLLPTSALSFLEQ